MPTTHEAVDLQENALEAHDRSLVHPLKVQGLLNSGRNVIELPTLPAGTYGYSCTMGMYSGRIVVIQPPPLPAD